jgi:CubicO group peptidase (beta-lactamase class C family)
MFTPGTAISYSNFGFDLLAAALSRAAPQHQPYARIFLRRESSGRSAFEIRPSPLD